MRTACLSILLCSATTLVACGKRDGGSGTPAAGDSLLQPGGDAPTAGGDTPATGGDTHCAQDCSTTTCTDVDPDCGLPCGAGSGCIEQCLDQPLSASPLFSGGGYGVCDVDNALTDSSFTAKLWGLTDDSVSFGEDARDVQSCIEFDFGAPQMACATRQVCVRYFPSQFGACGEDCAASASGRCDAGCPDVSANARMLVFTAGEQHNAVDYRLVGDESSNANGASGIETTCFSVSEPLRYVAVCKAKCEPMAFHLFVQHVTLTY